MSINIQTIFAKIGHSERVPLVKERYLMTKLFNSASFCKIMYCIVQNFDWIAIHSGL
jgi:hypothetical protein